MCFFFPPHIVRHFGHLCHKRRCMHFIERPTGLVFLVIIVIVFYFSFPNSTEVFRFKSYLSICTLLSTFDICFSSFSPIFFFLPVKENLGWIWLFTLCSLSISHVNHWTYALVLFVLCEEKFTLIYSCCNDFFSISNRRLNVGIIHLDRMLLSITWVKFYYFVLLIEFIWTGCIPICSLNFHFQTLFPVDLIFDFLCLHLRCPH